MRKLLSTAVVIVAMLVFPAALLAQEAAPDEVVLAATDALNSGDVDAAMEFFSDSAVVQIAPPEPGTSGIFDGAEEVHAWMDGLVAMNFHIEEEVLEVVGDTVTTLATWSSDVTHFLGIDALVGVEMYTVQDGLIQGFTHTLTDESQAMMGAALARVELCQGLPGHAELTEVLRAVVAEDNAGFGLHMWATVVNRDGQVCAVTFSGEDRGEQWPGSRVISAQKANTANAFSLPGLALSTGNLYSAVQPGGSLFGLQFSNPVDTSVAYGGSAEFYGQPHDPMTGQKVGGVNVFGGGLALYNAEGALLGALGVSGDTSCTDHITAWKVRDAFGLDYVPAGVSPTGDDNIVYDVTVDPATGHTTSASGWGHPECGFGEIPVSEDLPSTHSIEVPLPVIAGGFTWPQGIYVADDGSIWVVDSGVGGETEFSMPDPETGEAMSVAFGMSARVVRIAPDGTMTDVAALPSALMGTGPEAEFSGASGLTILDGTVYVTSGAWMGGMGERLDLMASVVKIEDGEVTELATTWTMEESDNPGGFILESHPYGITAGPNGNLWVADAGGNSLLKVDPATGDIELVAVFDGIPGPLPNPNRDGAMESDPVPTGVVVSANGTAYVSLLPGFPFLPGSSKVVMVSADGTVSDYATGFSMLTDLRLGPDGYLYAVSIGQFTEQGPVFNSGAIIRIHEGDASEVLVDGLSFPTSIDFDGDGNAYVTINGWASPPGAGQVVVLEGLTSMEAITQ